ncbi:MAG: ABC transporter substrate-binding protein [Alphaproteobacteria bacterium]|nr:ABC transporter substrate-binding protein [Alphaproteobacteria bacterium]
MTLPMFGSVSRRAVLAGGAAAGVLPSLGRADERAVLRVASPWEWTSNEPTDTGYLMTRLQLAETLVLVEPDGRLVGGLADAWAVDEDRLTWRFRLRAGVRFHDGTPLTAEAVITSLTRAIAGESLQQLPLDQITASADGVVIRTRTPVGHLPALLVDYAAVILAPASWGSDGKVQTVIGTGPYRLAGRDGQTVLDLVRFDGYWGSAPSIQRVRYTAIANGDTRTNVAVAGDVDVMFTTVPAATQRINSTGRMRVISQTIPRARVLAFNAGLPQFSDVRVRRAIALAVDRAGIAAAVLRHPASAATQLLPPAVADWHDAALPPLRTDPAAAMALLEEAGWRRGADGIRTKDGVRLAATVLTIANRPELAVMATAMQAQLKAVGLELAVEPVPSAGIPQAIQAGTMQMTMFARTYVNVPDPIATIIPDFTRQRSTWGALNWDGRPRMQALTDRYTASFDDRERADLRRQILRLLQDEVPVTPISWFEHTVAVHSRVRGLVIDPYEMRYMLHTLSLA